MATLHALCDAGRLTRLDPGLGPRTMEERVVYLSPRFVDWANQKLPDLESNWRIEQTPAEQLDALFETFCAGHELTYDRQFKALRFKVDGIWELKTADIRMFGWFPHRDCFIAYVADTAQRVKEHDLYTGYCGEAERFRSQLPLDEPKFIKGGDPHGVVSNYSYP